MRNELVITGTETQLLLSQTDDGTNTLFINGVEVPQSVWVGTDARWADWTTAEGQLVHIGKVKSADGNLMITRANEDLLFYYDFVPYVPFDPSDIGNSLVQLNERVTNLEDATLKVNAVQGWYEVATEGEQVISIPVLGYSGDGSNVIVDINGLICVFNLDYYIDADYKLHFNYKLSKGSIVHAVAFGINKG